MKKKLLSLSLVSALVLSTGAAAGAQPAVPTAAAAPAGTADDSAEPVTQESLQALRSQLEEQLYEAGAGAPETPQCAARQPQ